MPNSHNTQKKFTLPRAYISGWTCSTWTVASLGKAPLWFHSSTCSHIPTFPPSPHSLKNARISCYVFHSIFMEGTHHILHLKPLFFIRRTPWLWLFVGAYVMFWKTFRKEAGISQLLPYANSRGLFSIFRKANDQGLPLNPSMAYSNVPSSLLLPLFFFILKC